MRRARIPAGVRAAHDAMAPDPEIELYQRRMAEAELLFRRMTWALDQVLAKLELLVARIEQITQKDGL
jgi:hypothetical protein